jgi:hypothetical protein
VTFSHLMGGVVWHHLITGGGGGKIVLVSMVLIQSFYGVADPPKDNERITKGETKETAT